MLFQHTSCALVTKAVDAFDVTLLDVTKPIRHTVRTVGRSAENDSSMAAMAMFCAFPSDVARKCPSHVSLKVMRMVESPCDSRKSHRVATLKRTKQVEVTSGTDDMWRETMKGNKIPRERKAPTRIRKPASSGAG